MSRPDADADAETTQPRTQAQAHAQLQVNTLPFVSEFPSKVGRVELLDSRGRQLCWNLGRLTASEFAAQRAPAGIDVALFRPGRGASRVFVMFPVGDSDATRCFVRRVFKVSGVKHSGITLRRVLEMVELTAVFAIRQFLYTKHPLVTDDLVKRMLHRVIVCHLMCSNVGAYHVYVRNSFDVLS